MAGDRVHLTLVAPAAEFSCRPLAVAEPFALGHAYRVPLSRFTEDVGDQAAVADAAVAVDDKAGRLQLRDGGARRVRGTARRAGGRAVSDVERAITWWPGGGPEVYAGLLRDVDKAFA